MDGPTGSTRWAPPPPPAQTQTPSTVPAKSAKSPSVAGPAGPPVVNAPPVAKDGSKPPDSPRGPLIPAYELPSISENATDPTAAATSKYPSLLRTQAAFDAANDRLDAVDASKDGRVLVTVRIAQLQMAAAAKRTEWSLALEDANKGNNTQLQEACRLGLQRADFDVEWVASPSFVEARENPAYGRGLAAFARFAEARERGGDDVPAAAVDLLAAWKSAVSDAETRNGGYKEACQRQLARAEREVKAVMVQRFIDVPASVELNARSKR
jgi:hypothetical protein